MLNSLAARTKKISRIILNRLNNHRTTDAYLVGYPKCGNTWLQVLLGKYIQLLNGANEEEPLPLFSAFDDWGRCVRWHPQAPRIQFTHDGLEWTSQTAHDLARLDLTAPYRRKQTVLLVRAIPDMLVSLYWQHKTQVQPAYAGEISDFIRDPVFGVEKALAFYAAWEKSRAQFQRLFLLRYEDLRKQTEPVLEALLAFWNIPIRKEYVAQAAEFASFDNMRKLEQKNREKPQLIYQSSGLPIFATGDVQKSPEAYHVRKGQVGGYREYLSPPDIDFLREKMRGALSDWYGYRDGFAD